ncbi:hypothetical protein H5C76_14990 [Escherichia coli]|nr:hypothetical protein H5C76_14990 [Escherichia coli]
MHIVTFLFFAINKKTKLIITMPTMIKKTSIAFPHNNITLKVIFCANVIKC